MGSHLLGCLNQLWITMQACLACQRRKERALTALNCDPTLGKKRAPSTLRAFFLDTSLLQTLADDILLSTLEHTLIQLGYCVEQAARSRKGPTSLRFKREANSAVESGWDRQERNNSMESCIAYASLFGLFVCNTIVYHTPPRNGHHPRPIHRRPQRTDRATQQE